MADLTGPARSQSTEATQVEVACNEAVRASAELARLGRRGRARLLRAIADALESDRPGIVDVATDETGLAPTRIESELSRTVFQLRLFAGVCDDGSYLEASIDRPTDIPMGPRPDLRRMVIPIGPVAVFAASNFPLAFSVPGGDTASAIAAGCAVVVKVHPAHPRTSLRAHRCIVAACGEVGAPDTVVQLVVAEDAGVALVQHPLIAAVGFTGSVAGGRALHDVAAARPQPIPFYGELGSLNPLVITPAAAAERGAQIAAGLVQSFTLAMGQFCTKPGLVLVPATEAGSALQAAVRELAEDVAAGPMLSERIATGYASGLEQLRAADGVRVEVAGTVRDFCGASARLAAPAVLAIDAGQLSGPLLEECFGPVVVLVAYRDENELLATLQRLNPSLAAAIHVGLTDGEEPAAEMVRRVLDVLISRAGRIVWDGYPTGVAVTWSMHHGGPYPATTAPLHTSVGTTAIRRWLRPVSFQDVPEGFRPDAVRDRPADPVPQRVDLG